MGAPNKEGAASPTAPSTSPINSTHNHEDRYPQGNATDRLPVGPSCPGCRRSLRAGQIRGHLVCQRFAPWPTAVAGGAVPGDYKQLDDLVAARGAR